MVRLDIAAECPVLNQCDISQIRGLLDEPEIGSTVVKVDDLADLQRHLDDWLLGLGLVLVVALHYGDEELFVGCVFKDHLLQISIHEVVLLTDIELHVEHFILGMQPAMLFFDDVFDLAQLRLF